MVARRLHVCNDFLKQTDLELTAVLMRERFALGYFMVSPGMDNTALGHMRSDIVEYLGPNRDLADFYLRLMKIAEPSLTLKESLAANPQYSELRRTLSQARVALPELW